MTSDRVVRISCIWLEKHIVIDYGFLIKYFYSRKAYENNQNKLYLRPSERKSFQYNPKVN